MRPRGPGEPPLRASGAGGPGTSREDLPTLRVTNLSEETREEDLRELFGGFGRVARVYVGRDKETGIGKGFAFVSFEDRQNAQRAMDKLHGKGYDNLILNVQWSRESRLCASASTRSRFVQNQGPMVASLQPDRSTGFSLHCNECTMIFF